MTNRNILSFSHLLLLLLCSCAGQQAPQGGPVDTEPPQIISTYPAPNTTRFNERRLVFEFNEYVERRTFEESIFISPAIGRVEFEWSGTEVEVRFEEELRKNTTYVVTIGTDVADLRNRNKMARAFSLAFSTGETIDHGVIEGKVYTQKPADPSEGVMVFAYQLVNSASDTLNPVHVAPSYITQTGKGGEFTLQHLALGTYRILAVRDAYKNLLYDPEADEYGVPSSDIVLTEQDSIAVGIRIRLSKQDTTAPRLLKVTVQSRTQVLLEFSEAMHQGTFFPQGVLVVDTLSNQEVRVKAIAQLYSKPASFMVATDTLERERPYRIRITDARDLAGNQMNPLANSLPFTVTDERDSLDVKVIGVSVADSARGIVLRPELHVGFSTPLLREEAERGIRLVDPKKNAVPLNVRWIGGAITVLQPREELAGRTFYRLEIDLSSLKDLFSRRGRDTTFVITFETLDPEALSAIEGRVVDTHPTDTSGSLILTALNVEKKEAPPSQLVLSSSGPFLFNHLEEGRYILEVFRDRNGNMRYDAGLPYPFQTSERFVQYRDTLRLRARWPLEGILLELR